MDEVRASLTPAERIILADFWEDKVTLKVLQKALLQRQVGLAVSTLANAPSWDNVQANRGETLGLKWIISFLKANHKEIERSRNKATN